MEIIIAVTGRITYDKVVGSKFFKKCIAIMKVILRMKKNRGLE
jgi:hypothetical protein